MNYSLLIFTFLIFYLECIDSFNFQHKRRIKLHQIFDSPSDPEPNKAMAKPTIISPTGKPGDANIEKFLMMYTCKKCNSRNAQFVSKIAYTQGIVISTCKSCNVNHLIADNLSKLDMSEYGKRIDEYLEAKGEVVQKLSISPTELENNYLIDKDGVLTLQPKIGGQVICNSY